MNWMNTYGMISRLQNTNTYLNSAYGINQSSNNFNQGISFQNIFNQAQSGVSEGKAISTPMDEIFEEAAKTYGVDVNLLKAIGKAESNFRADATSGAGAMGVMQLMPGTAKSLGVTDPYDARQNIMGGAKYIADKLSAYGGDVKLALAAYNAGSGNVAKYGGVPPFKETQNYIKKIFEYMGQDINTGQVVQNSESASTSSYNNQALGSLGLSSEDMQYFVEMMRAQMDMKLSKVVSGLFDENEESNGFDF